MSRTVKLSLALPLIALVAGCQTGANNRVDTTAEIEATTDTAISGGTVTSSTGAQVQP